jgi:peptide/nickel transport system substrate-binding protein
LLDTAGYAKGSDGIRAGKCDGKDVKFSLGIETTNKQVRVDTMNALNDMYSKIGVELKPNPLPAGTYFGDYGSGADLKTGKYDLAIYTTGFFPDPDPGLSFSCSAVPSKDNQSGSNDYHYCDQTGKMQELLDKGLSSADPTVRKPAYDEIQQYQYDQVLFIPLYARANVYGYTDRLVFPKSSADCGWACNITDYDVK